MRTNLLTLIFILLWCGDRFRLLSDCILHVTFLHEINKFIFFSMCYIYYTHVHFFRYTLYLFNLTEKKNTLFSLEILWTVYCLNLYFHFIYKLSNTQSRTCINFIYMCSVHTNQIIIISYDSSLGKTVDLYKLFSCIFFSRFISYYCLFFENFQVFIRMFFWVV